jgi:iron complex outermembrane receptor protein
MRDRSTVNTFFAFPLGFTPLPPGFFLRFDSPRGDTDAYAAFGDVTWKASERLRLIGGLRWSRDEITFTAPQRRGPRGGPRAAAGRLPLRRDDHAWESVTYRAGAQYEVADHAQAYATVSNGFKSGGVNLSGCDDPFNPEKITSYEAASKAASWRVGRS